MINSIFVALSGMRGHERGLNVISNNVSNMSTPAFRGSIVSFTDVFVGGSQSELTGQQRLGGGLDASRTILNLRTGDPQQTDRALDLFLKGDGFFVLQDEDGETRYTRNGRFDFNDEQELVTLDQKFKVMTRNASGALVALTLKDLQVSQPKATTTVTFEDVLFPDDSEHTIDSLTVFDNLGAAHKLRVVFQKEPASGGATAQFQIIVSEGGTEIGRSTLQLLGSSVLGNPVLPLTLTLGNTTQPISFDFTSMIVIPQGTGSTQQTSLRVKQQDGRASGTIATKTFDEKGVLKLTYSNGETADGPKLALAQITDQLGLIEVGNSAFAYRGSQAVTLREAGDDLQVQSQSLELSNVDLTQQFSELILMQRGYQASSQVISTANDMLQELLQIRGNR